MLDAATLDAGAEFDRLFASASKPAEIDPLFAADCLHCVDAVQSDSTLFPGVVAFVALTIQQPFSFMPQAIASVAEHDLQSPYLWGFKPDSLRYAREHRAELHRASQACHAGDIGLEDLLLVYLRIPGLGLIKSSFLAQLTVGDGACLDTLNLRSLGLHIETFKLPKKLTEKTIRKKIQRYNATWSAHGDSGYWWSRWCEYVGSRDVNARGYKLQGFDGGAPEVSTIHRLAVTGGIASE